MARMSGGARRSSRGLGTVPTVDMYYTYILKSLTTSGYYIGSTEDLAKRLQYHNAGKTQSTRGKGPWVIAYKEAYELKSDALKREGFLKRQRNREFYERLITGRSSDG